ncbi:MAG: hypothetical protein R3E53_19185 [Myxococcota bacterium]
MDRYGSDRPDTRVLLELVDLTDVFPPLPISRRSAASPRRAESVKALPIDDARS